MTGQKVKTYNWTSGSTVVHFLNLPSGFWRLLGGDFEQHSDCSSAGQVGDLLGDITFKIGPPRFGLPLDRLNTAGSEAPHDGFARNTIILQFFDGLHEILHLLVLA